MEFDWRTTFAIIFMTLSVKSAVARYDNSYNRIGDNNKVSVESLEDYNPHKKLSDYAVYAKPPRFHSQDDKFSDHTPTNVKISRFYSQDDKLSDQDDPTKAKLSRFNRLDSKLGVDEPSNAISTQKHVQYDKMSDHFPVNAKLSVDEVRYNRLKDQNTPAIEKFVPYDRLSDNFPADTKISRYDNRYDRLSDHTVVTDSNVFPYVVAILKKQSYLCAGALLDDKWVLTSAGSLFPVKELIRVIRIRLGSINYKKSGVLLPIKTIEVHPSFEPGKPVFDVALVLLSSRVRLTSTVYPIRMQTKQKPMTASHFLVTAWTPSMQVEKKPRHPTSMDVIKKHRLLAISHLHPANSEQCQEDLAALEVNDTANLICLDPDLKTDPCWRDTGAPVVLNGVLWGIMSSWRPDDCSLQSSSNFVTVVSAPGVRDWMHQLTHDHYGNSTVEEEDDELSDEDSD